MKVRISYTVEVDPAVIRELIAEYGTGETVAEYVRSYLGSVAPLMDETIAGALGVSHQTNVIKSNF